LSGAETLQRARLSVLPGQTRTRHQMVAAMAVAQVAAPPQRNVSGATPSSLARGPTLAGSGQRDNRVICPPFGPSQRLSIRLGPGTTPMEPSMAATTPTSLSVSDTWSSGSLTHPPGVVIDPAVLAEQAVARMQLTAINPQIAPRPLSVDADSMGLVGLPVWLWTDPTPTTWGPNSASASAGGITVTATARVERVEWSMGDGTVVTCVSAGTPYDSSYGVERTSPDCGHRYQTTSGDHAGQGGFMGSSQRCDLERLRVVR
jgi:hypothetical protein